MTIDYSVGKEQLIAFDELSSEVAKGSSESLTKLIGKTVILRPDGGVVVPFTQLTESIGSGHQIQATVLVVLTDGLEGVLVMTMPRQPV